ncbi:MAG: alpha-glucuronidase [Bacteroidales bacterium]|nr:alpha-glucuronidase [Bacteroidales bacterium]
MKVFKTFVLISALILAVSGCKVEKPADTDGHDLWFHNLEQVSNATPASYTTEAIAQNEIDRFWKGKEAVEIKVLGSQDAQLGRDGYRLVFSSGKVSVEANTAIGTLYGVYGLLRLQQTDALPKGSKTITEVPAYEYRAFNHWDNLNRSVERGYAGRSLWNWDELPDNVSPVYEEYARANASVGINATAINNVNANAQILTPEYLQKVKVLADIFRPYGLKVFLSLNFAAPKHIGGLDTSDPLDPRVAQFWKDKTAEIYALIPDFGGYLVKANSEGQSGPQDYGRTHADGANMLADALAPYGGVVFWRAFVYDAQAEDRAMQASDEFVPLDGQFRDNVLIQVKNGPIDFQPREPISPLFGQAPKTNLMAEFQITQEYLGHSKHMVYLHPLWKECLDTDTYEFGQGSTVAAITEGKYRENKLSAISGVTNIGDDVNWCGHQMAQINWYSYGRMAWNPDLSSEQIADEWLRQTFSSDPKFIKPVKDMLLRSREVNVSYEMPLGLHHIMAGNAHFGPGPWESAARKDWSPLFYHKAGPDGVGFDRTVATGSGATAQYHEPLASTYENLETCPENLLLWFHHLPWDYKMKDGKTLWDELCYTYQKGIEDAAEYIKIWEKAEPYVDNQRYQEVRTKLIRQAKDAMWWRDAVMLYFQTFSNMPIPDDCYPPQHDLEELKQVGVFRRPQQGMPGAVPPGAPQGAPQPGQPQQPRPRMQMPQIYDVLPEYTLPSYPEL